MHRDSPTGRKAESLTAFPMQNIKAHERRCIMEIWKDVIGYEDLYQVSSFGRVRSKTKNCIIQQRELKLRYGYLEVRFYVNGKTIPKRVHRLVAEAFIENPNGYTDVNHKDEDKKNNHVENLEWCTRSYNTRYGKRSNIIAEKLSRPVEQLLNGSVIRVWKSASEAGRNGYDGGRVSMCCNGKASHHKGFQWRWA